MADKDHTVPANVLLSSSGKNWDCAKSKHFESGQKIHQLKVHDLQERVEARRKSLNDSLEDDVRTFLINEGELHTYDDLTKVNPVTPTTVLKCLQARYRARVFYTHAGCTLVALNPFHPVPHLYSLEVMKEYHTAPKPQEFKPHIFIVAEEAYRNVQGQVEPSDQSLVVSGESGAGKTWTSRCLMKYYATVAASSDNCQDTVERIEKRVLDSNPIMEAFGNACTLRNNNSSRFGKYIQLQLNRSQLLVGASVQTYLLEKTRVAFQAANERNFHIFYQMMKGATDQQRQAWMMPHDQRFNWLPNAEKTLEEDCFDETLEAMVHLGIKSDKRAQIFRILAGILHLGNVAFSPATDESQPCDLEEESKVFLGTTAELLKIPVEELQSCLRVRALKAGRQSTLLKPCSQAECSVRRDCLAKVIYAQLFDWLVSFINKSMCADNSSWCNFIGLLDVYGFECFQHNNLEQLCINYANEKLQQHFVGHYLKAQQEEYVSEGLEWSFVQYQDNQGCLDLIEGSPTSIFSLLNEVCRLNRASDAKQFMVRLEKELSSNDHISWDKFSQQPHFIVSHYAGKVSYEIEGMMEKNKDPVPPELIQLLQKSEDPLMHSMFADTDAEGPTARGHNKVVTVVSKFKNSLESLMKILHTTTPHYTRCIKPNPDCRPLTFKKEEVITQLEACGIVETINISAAGFPIRIPYASFLQRYGLIGHGSASAQLTTQNGLESGDKDSLGSAVMDVLKVVLRRHTPDPQLHSDTATHSSLVHCGKTKVFLTHVMLEYLEEHRFKVRSQKAFCIQCYWRKYQRRRREAERRAATFIQAGLCKKYWSSFHETWWKGVAWAQEEPVEFWSRSDSRDPFMNLLSLTLTLQVFRSWLIRQKVKKWHKAAFVIQQRWKEWRMLMDALAEAELDDAEDLQEEIVASEAVLDSLAAERGSVQLSSLQEPVAVRSWPMGLALASAPSITVALTATGFQKVMSVMAMLKMPFRSGEYRVETNQFDQGVASIRAQPRGSIKLHLQRSPLRYADMYPGHKGDGITGFNQILLEKH